MPTGTDTSNRASKLVLTLLCCASAAGIYDTTDKYARGREHLSPERITSEAAHDFARACTHTSAARRIAMHESFKATEQEIYRCFILNEQSNFMNGISLNEAARREAQRKLSESTTQ